MSDANETKGGPAWSDWKPPADAEYVEGEELPGLPAKLQHLVSTPELRMIPMLVITCPRCKAEGNDGDMKLMEFIGKGGVVCTTCTECGLPIAVKRGKEEQKPRIVVAGGPTPEQRSQFAKLMHRGNGRRR